MGQYFSQFLLVTQICFKILPFDLYLIFFYYIYIKQFIMEPSLNKPSFGLYPQTEYPKQIQSSMEPLSYKSDFKKFYTQNLQHSDQGKIQNVKNCVNAHQNSFQRKMKTPLKYHFESLFNKNKKSLEKMTEDNMRKEQISNLQVFKYQFNREDYQQMQPNERKDSYHFIEEDDVQIISVEEFLEGDGVISSRWKVKNRQKNNKKLNDFIKEEQLQQKPKEISKGNIKQGKIDQEIESGQIVSDKTFRMDVEIQKQKIQSEKIQSQSQNYMLQNLFNFESIVQNIMQNDSLKNMIEYSSNNGLMSIAQMTQPKDDNITREKQEEANRKRLEKNKKRREQRQKQREKFKKKQQQRKKQLQHKLKQNSPPILKQVKNHETNYKKTGNDDKVNVQNQINQQMEMIEQEKSLQWKVIGLKKHHTEPQQYLYKIKKQGQPQKWISEAQLCKSKQALLQAHKFYKSKIVFSDQARQLFVIDD